MELFADLSIATAPEEGFDESHRMINLDLAGGALLDLGVYSLTWTFQLLYHTLPKDQRQAPHVIGAIMSKEARTSADEHTSILLNFPKSTPTGKHSAHAFATTSMRLDFDHNREDHAVPAVRLQGEKGEIQVFGPIYRPSRYKFVPAKSSGKSVEDKTFEFPGEGHGMFWEADAAAQGVLNGNLEDSTMPWEESIAIMEVMDEVRERCDLKYPDDIESTRYPLDLKARKI